MKELPYEHPKDTAEDLIKGDYLNEYGEFMGLFKDRNKKLSYKPRSFSERYPNMTFNGLPFKVSEAEALKIKELDGLSVRATLLISSETVEVDTLIAIIIQVAELCGRPEIADRYRELSKE